MSHPFIDPISDREVTLHVGAKAGVQHGDCPQWADVFPELDSFYCSSCGWNGRISGAWVVHLTQLGTTP